MHVLLQNVPSHDLILFVLLLDLHIKYGDRLGVMHFDFVVFTRRLQMFHQ